MLELDDEVRSLLARGDVSAATTAVLRHLGPEVLGFLCGVVGESDGYEVFSPWSERLWHSLKTFRHACSIRTWCYVLARHEISRFKRGVKKHEAGRQPISQFEEILEEARSQTRSALATDKRQKLDRLRRELSADDRMILILRVDRKLAWEDIALAFADGAPVSIHGAAHGELRGTADQASPAAPDGAALKREIARLRKRYQLIKERLLRRSQAVPQD
jgi:RNA polymerase sigma-70 factor (ECF subfamily)